MPKTFTQGYNEDQANPSPVGDNLTGEEILGFDPSTGTKSLGAKLNQVAVYLSQFFSLKDLESDVDANTAHRQDLSIHFTDAPADGKVYGRVNNAWAEISSGGVPSALYPPINLTATSSSSTTIDLAWEAPADTGTALRYTVYNFDGGVETLIHTTADLTVLNFIATGLAVNSTHTYFVRCADDIGESTNSVPATATTDSVAIGTGQYLMDPQTATGLRFFDPTEALPENTLVAPNLTNAYATGSTTIQVQFEDSNLPEADSYKVYKNLANPVTTTSKNMQLTGLQPSTEYSITVTAVRN